MSKLTKLEKKGNGPDYMFECPACGYSHGVWTTRLPGESHPLWTFNGDMEKPTFNPSLLVRGQFVCHSFVRDGKIQYLSDCTHSMAGKTIELPNI